MGVTTRKRRTDSIIDYDSGTELTWYGAISKFGRGEDFVIEHITFNGKMIYGYMSQGDALIKLTGTMLDIESGPEDRDGDGRNLFFKLEGQNTTTMTKYSIRGYFDKFELKASMRDLPPRMVTRILQLDLKAKPCTVFQEPGKRLSQGQVKITNNRIFVMFLEKGRMNILSAMKNKVGVYVGFLIRGGSSRSIFTLIQTQNPLRVKHKANVFSFAEENFQFGMVIEVFNDSIEGIKPAATLRKIPSNSSRRSSLRGG